MSKEDKFNTLVLCLTAKFGRMPTEDEVVGYIFGDSNKRKEIWDSESSKSEESEMSSD